MKDVEADKGKRHGSMWTYVAWSLPGLCVMLGIPLKAATEPPSGLWYFAEIVQYAGFLAPFCFAILSFCFVAIPPKTPGAKLIALILAAPTAFLAWQAVALAGYYLGLSDSRIR